MSTGAEMSSTRSKTRSAGSTQEVWSDRGSFRSVSSCHVSWMREGFFKLRELVP